jgi:homoserine O-acetyltransferase
MTSLITNLPFAPYYGSNVKFRALRQPLTLECGSMLHRVHIAYHTYGTLNAEGSNVIWICHALTANSDVGSWWEDMLGVGKAFDPTRHYIICANVLGSCYGTTGPLAANPATRLPYYHRFPLVTPRDIALAHEMLRRELGIESIAVVVGGSVGAFQALEWCIECPDIVQSMVFIAGGVRATPWAVAINEAQRMAIDADPTFYHETSTAGAAGMAAARAMGMVSYRSYNAYNCTQADTDNDILTNYKAMSYQRYQGDKLANRFNAHSYYRLLQMLDAHNICRSRDCSADDILNGIDIPVLVVAVDSDILFPPCEQEFMAQRIPNASYAVLNSIYGHDAFLIETRKLTQIIVPFMDKLGFLH